MEFERSKRPPMSATPPPRTLNIQKFAESRGPELESLSSIVANRLNNDYRSRRNKRRRTTGHDNRISKKNRLKKRRKSSQIDKDGGGSSISENDKENVKVPPRRIRRRTEFKMNPVSGFVSSGDGTKRLRMHLWLAKRFTMVKRWGFYLPLGLQGRGRGSRAVLKWYKHGALIHDASYDCAVQLEGPEDSLLAISKMVMVPPPTVSREEVSQSVHCGICYGSAMLHHVGDPVSRLIAPVTYMWRPFCKDHIDIDVERDSVADGDSMCEKNECIASLRQLWIWIHAAAFEEGFDALRFASQKQMHNDGACTNVLSLKGKLAKLEVMGSKATHILQKMLYPMSSTSMDSELRKYSVMKPCTNSELQKSFVLEHAVHLPPHAILSLIVHDPRDLPVKQTENVPELPSISPEGDLPDEDCKKHASLTSGAPNRTEEAVSSLWLKPEINSVFLSDNKDLWDFHGVMNPPMEENLLCIEKHDRRLSSFYLDSKNSVALSNETKEGSSRSCPILLLKNTNQSGSRMGWSIILPLSWVKPFWIRLVSCGAHVIGLRERRWIACDVELPSFPFDFPDCKAFSCFMDAEASASDHAAGLRPHAMRPLKVPIPPPWNCVRLTVEGESPKVRDPQTLDVHKSSGVVPGSSLVNSDPKYCEAGTLKQDDVSFQGFIARTSNSLSDFLNEINGGHLLIFPNMAMGKKALSNVMARGGLCWEPKGIKHIPVDRKQCFFRVLLHAFKEGVFEEGAVVCAPILTDISLWTSRSEEQEGLQIPPSLLKSYFILQPSGKWELQVPEDPATRQFHRWPIGFVTSGFVRGSAKPAAEAICEGTLLAQLREEQWNEMQEKGRPEIFVLVRNLRSTSYRLALATIVLEQHEDLEFM